MTSQASAAGGAAASGIRKAGVMAVSEAQMVLGLKEGAPWGEVVKARRHTSHITPRTSHITRVTRPRPHVSHVPGHTRHRPRGASGPAGMRGPSRAVGPAALLPPAVRWPSM